MKVCAWVSWHTEADLYIPHGSDESAATTLPMMLNPLFISHMVQMKARAAAAKAATQATLYPTWFRWK